MDIPIYWAEEWLADKFVGVPNQMHNVGIEVGTNSTRDIYSGLQIATWPLQNRKRHNNEQSERAARSCAGWGQSTAIQAPILAESEGPGREFNEEDPSNQFMPARVPARG